MKNKEKGRIETLENSIDAMREKIEEQIPVFMREPLAQKVTVGTGEEMLRQNPYVSEFRALVKDYSIAIKNYKELAGDDGSAEIKSLDDLRAKFKVAN